MQILLLNKNLLYLFTALLFFLVTYTAKAAEVTLLNQNEISITESIEFKDQKNI